MSIINNASPGSQIRLICLIDRVLNRRKKKRPIQLSDLIETCRPENLPNSKEAKKRFKENLTFWLKEGLWREGEDGVAILDIHASEDNLSNRVLNICVHRYKNKNILEGNRVEPFLRAISVLLAQDPLTFQGQIRGAQQHLNSPSDFAERINGWMPKKLSINSSNEGNTLKDWGIFLGFLEPYTQGVIVDPTLAIEPYLGTIFSNKPSLPIRDFIDALGEYLPMLDGGIFRNKVEPLMVEKGWNPPLENRVSASLSHALLRLQGGLRITLDKPSDDSRSMILKNTDGKDRSVGLVRYRGNI
jgi:hypothetical protein